ncbi:transport and Golgi organization protein 2 homolog [Crassostrea angulata]|uniref:transport and Golgi organization protein 2 homolog n=1 Tax=Magallana angulata TaxID=2784310 RepID=UPI0022B14626|nr:transport and Golgi organization protein 2 homolog [Crassostrea angulata]
MCVLFLYVNDIPEPNKYRIILVMNRDKSWDRPTKPLDYWKCKNRSFAGGQDVLFDGNGQTWLGMSKEGKIAVLLNVIEAKYGTFRYQRRGFLVSDFLYSNMDGHSYLEQCIKPKSDNYKGFHLLLLDCSSSKTDVNYFNNRFTNNRSEDIRDDKGFICLGNSRSEEAPWIKVAKGKEKFKDIVKNFNNKDSKSKLESALLKLLKDNTVYLNDPVLEMQTKNEKPFEGTSDKAKPIEQLCSLFVYMPELRRGTRTHSIITVDFEGNCEFLEFT